jgi:hypothetical protein
VDADVCKFWRVQARTCAIVGTADERDVSWSAFASVDDVGEDVATDTTDARRPFCHEWSGSPGGGAVVEIGPRAGPGSGNGQTHSATGPPDDVVRRRGVGTSDERSASRYDTVP